MNHVVVTGMGVVSSIGDGITEFQDALMCGKSGIQRLHEIDGDNQMQVLSASLDGYSIEKSMEKLNLLEAEQKRITRIIRRMPMALQTSVVSALQAWKQSGFYEKETNNRKIAIVVAGSNLSQNYMYQTTKKFIASEGLVNPAYAIQFLDTNFIGVLSEVLGIQGEGMTVGGASASGNVAILQAYRMIRYAIADICVCVGPQFDYSKMELQSFINLGAIGDFECFDKPQEACRPFDRRHRGFVPGQASGCLILESEGIAMKRDAKIYGQVVGGAMVLDANHLSNANVNGEMKAMKGALLDAKVAKEQIDYVNAHGTSTPSGDVIESEAIYKIFLEHAKNLWVNSTKCLTGHCMYSAGIIEMIASVIQMNQRFIHANINLYDPIRDDIKLVGRQKEDAEITYAMSNSFGFGGINTSVILGINL